MTSSVQLPIVAVEGIIGCGKSTYAQWLATRLGFTYVAEPLDENPYLDRFYEDQKQWALHMQMWLVARRVKAIQVAREKAINDQFEHGRPQTHGLVIDRSILGDRVFADHHRRVGNISSKMWPIYDDFFSTLSLMTTVPNAVVFINITPALALKNVQARGRASEVGAKGGVTIEYLTQLRRGYVDMANLLKNDIKLDWANKSALMEVTSMFDTPAKKEAIAEELLMFLPERTADTMYRL